MKETNQTNLKMPKQWKKLDSNFFRFENVGDSISGLLMEKRQGDRMMFYKLKSFDGKEIKFHGTSQLDDNLSLIDIPCYIKITLVSTTPMAKGTMNNFEVEKGEN